jgi:hypothetical protein
MQLPASQPPQKYWRCTLQLSRAVTAPHDLPRRAQNEATDSGVHVDWQVLLAPQNAPPSQPPQLSVRGWPVQGSTSVTAPQVFPSCTMRAQKTEAASGVQADWQVWPALHVKPGAQAPQVSVRGCPVQASTSVMSPQVLPCCAARSQNALAGSRVQASRQRPVAASHVPASQVPHERPQASTPHWRAPQVASHLPASPVEASGPPGLLHPQKTSTLPTTACACHRHHLQHR